MLAGRSALVTGGSRGIGRAMVRALAEAGAKVLFTYRQSESEAKALEDELRPSASETGSVRCDVRDAESVRSAVDAALTRFGRVDILVNNAGILREQLLAFTKETEWNEVVDTNLKGPFLFCKALVRQMGRQHYGRIINISSVAALMGDVPRASYCASKAGLIGLTRAVAREAAGQGITVNAVAPGIIETDLLARLPETKRKSYEERIPMGRFGHASEVASVVVFLASDRSAYITGQVLCVDGGLHM
ncbi:MAG: 3-oxoacyl-ACP reductase FabG [Planctomycetes bacterium]|nr:3-oxoacyl-ACP reductase FabG [Planctomycetota bacterium]